MSPLKWPHHKECESIFVVTPFGFYISAAVSRMRERRREENLRSFYCSFNGSEKKKLDTEGIKSRYKFRQPGLLAESAGVFRCGFLNHIIDTSSPSFIMHALSPFDGCTMISSSQKRF